MLSIARWKMGQRVGGGGGGGLSIAFSGLKWCFFLDNRLNSLTHARTHAQNAVHVSACWFPW